ncbi:hypothetical protein [Carnobacterium maltaromaticum]|uniref:hypothetical protein n=1 Tax=Carnobacterium maltaromaticum TaxID=2751 RepID=UPI0012F9F5AA|nr:hypothetical protein [Carnobacterium maltaromaticum]
MQNSIFSKEMEQMIAEMVGKMVTETMRKMLAAQGYKQPEAAEEYAGGVSDDTLARWEVKGLSYSKINSIKLYSVKDLDDFIEKYKVNK